MIRPINFRGPMVRAVLDGRKTHHCVILKPQPRSGFFFEGYRYHDLKNPECWAAFHCDPPVRQRIYVPIPFSTGDKLRVRETWSLHRAHGQHVTPGREDHGERWGPWSGLPIAVSPDKTQVVYYREGFDRSGPPRWRSSSQMPGWASRLTLTVEAVRVFRVQEITEAEVRAEGCQGWAALDYESRTPLGEFRDYWNARHGADAWDRNDWVAGLTFTVHRCNVDQ